MSGDYIYIVIIAFVVGAPAGAFMMNYLLNAIYPTEIPVVIWPYALAISLMIAMVGLTILTLFKRVTQENPTETLRME
jgi:ABC-type antimicrobial peptide transport system permease subunit